MSSTTPPSPKLPDLEVIGYLRATKSGQPVWDEGCVCEDPVYPSDPDGSDAECISMAVVRLSDAKYALQAQAEEHAAEVRRIRDIRNANAEEYRTEIRLCREEIAALRDRLAFLTQPGALRFVEEDSGLYRVYEDKALPERPTHFWQSMTTLYYPSAAKAIDAAIDAARAQKGEAK